MNNNNFIPYIAIQTSKGKMKCLIDTGANKNYISPDHVNIGNCKTETGISVTNINGTHTIDKSASFDRFGINKKLKFYIFKFHKFFDGLIGYESLRNLKARIDIGKNSLKIGRKTFQMQKRFPEDNGSCQQTRSTIWKHQSQTKLLTTLDYRNQLPVGVMW